MIYTFLEFFAASKREKIRDFIQSNHQLLENCDFRGLAINLLQAKVINSEQLERLQDSKSRIEANRQMFLILHNDPSLRKLDKVVSVLENTDHSHEHHYELADKIKKFVGT